MILLLCRIALNLSVEYVAGSARRTKRGREGEGEKQYVYKFFCLVEATSGMPCKRGDRSNVNNPPRKSTSKKMSVAGTGKGTAFFVFECLTSRVVRGKEI